MGVAGVSNLKIIRPNNRKEENYNQIQNEIQGNEKDDKKMPKSQTQIKREDFLKDIRNYNGVKDRTGADLPLGFEKGAPRIVTEKEKREREERYKREREKNQQRLQKINKRKKTIRGVKIGVAAFLASLGITTGVLIATNVNNDKVNENNVSLSEALESGKSPRELGLSEAFVNEYNSVQELLEKEDLSNQEIIDLGNRINRLQKANLTSKIDRTHSPLSNDSIEVIETYESGEKIYLLEINGRRYGKQEIFNISGTFSKDIEQQLKNIKDMEHYMEKIQNGNFNKEKVLNQYEKVIDNIEEFGASEVKIDANGKMTVIFNKKPQQINTNTQQKNVEDYER